MYEHIEAADLGRAEGYTELRCEGLVCNELYQRDGTWSAEEIRQEAEMDGWQYDGRDMCPLDNEDGWWCP